MLETGVWLKVTQACFLNWSEILVTRVWAWFDENFDTYRVLFSLVSVEVQGVQVEELWSLDPEQFDNLK